jgi:hypothetical protein
LAIPAPPEVIREPVEVDVEFVVEREIRVSKLPLIPPYTLLAIPTPPPTINAPVDVEVESVVFVILVICRGIFPDGLEFNTFLDSNI